MENHTDVMPNAQFSFNNGKHVNNSASQTDHCNRNRVCWSLSFVLVNIYFVLYTLEYHKQSQFTTGCFYRQSIRLCDNPLETHDQYCFFPTEHMRL
jgi:hypothetical protein